MAAIGRLVRLAPKIKDLSVLHRSICKANVALKPFKLPSSPSTSYRAWNLIRCCSSESVLVGNEAAVELDEQQIETSELKDINSPVQQSQRLEPRNVVEDRGEQRQIGKDISECLNMYFSVSREKVEEFLRVVETQEYRMQKHDMILLLRCMGDLMPGATKEEKCQMVDRFWSKIKETEDKLDHHIYNTLIMVYIENDHPFSPAEILQEMQDNGVEPNMVTFKRLITAYCNKGDVTSAKQLLQHMQAENVPIGPEVFNSFIKGHMINGDIEGAEEVLQVMRDMNVTITDDTYARIICGLADMKEINQIPKYLQELEEIQCRLISVVDIMISMKENGLTEFDSEINKLFESSMLFLSDFATCVNKCLARGHMDLVEKLRPHQNKEPFAKTSIAAYLENYIHCLTVSNFDELTLENMLTDMMNKDETLTAAFPSLAYLFYQLNFTEFAVLLLKKARDMKQDVKPHCFFPAVVQYKNTRNIEKMTELLGTMKGFYWIERKHHLKYIAEEMVPFFVKNLDGEDDVVQFLKKNLKENSALLAYFLYLLRQKSPDKALEFAKKKNLSIPYEILSGGIQSIPDHKIMHSFMEMCYGEGHFKFEAHEYYLNLLLKYGEKENAWDEVEDILKDVDLMIFKTHASVREAAPESIRKRIQDFTQAQKEYNEKVKKEGVFIARQRLQFAVMRGNIDACKDKLNMLLQVKDFNDYEILLIDFLCLCVEKGDLKDALDYFVKYCDLHSDALKKKMVSKSLRLRHKVRNLLNRACIISPTQAEKLQKLFLETGLVHEGFQLFSLEKVQELLKKDLDKCTDHIIKSYKASRFPHGILIVFQELIKTEKHEDLQKVFDRMALDLGERFVLSHLALSLINCDQIQKALRVCSVQEADIPSLLCKLIPNHGQMEQVERFVEATKYVSYRTDLLNALLELYLNKRMYDKAVKVVDMYEEEFLEMTENQKYFLISKLTFADYPIPPSLKKDQERYRIRRNEFRNNMPRNEPQLNKPLQEKSVDHFETPFGLTRLYQKNRELFDQVTSEVEDDEKKLAYIFCNFLTLNKVKKAKELISKHPDMLTGSDYGIFESLNSLTPRRNLDHIEKILRKDFTDRRDLLLKFHTERLKYIVKNSIQKSGMIQQRYDKLLEDGFQISDIDTETLSDFEQRLTRSRQHIPWKPDSRIRTKDVLKDKLERNEPVDWFEDFFNLHYLNKLDSELFDKVTSEVEDDEKKLAYIFCNFLSLNKVEKAKELVSKHPDMLTGSDYGIFEKLNVFLRTVDQKDRTEKKLREDFTDRRDLLLKFHTERLKYIVKRYINNRGAIRQRYDKLLEDGFQISDIDTETLSDLEQRLTRSRQSIPWKTNSSSESIVTETISIPTKSEELDSESKSLSQEPENKM